MITRVRTHRLPRRGAGIPALALAAAVVTALAGCGSTTAHASGTGTTSAKTTSSAFPVTIAAANGKVHVTRRPTSIISLSPSATEMLYAIGAGRQVTAVDQDSNYPPQAPRTSINPLSPNIESIVARKPSLVVVAYDAAALTKRLAAFSIPVLYLPAPANLSGVWAQYQQLGAATGHLKQASAEVASLKHQISAIVAQVPHHSKPVSYYYELDQTYYSVTSSTFIGKLLGLLGLKSIADAAKGAAAAGGYPQLSAEYIIKANPSYIILADTICCHQSAATVSSRPGWSSLSAVKSHRIIALNDNIASRWGPRIIVLLKTVLAALRSGR
ncbi:MAG: ABC transporter substrate-binding protein [Actinomycetota bacterium]|nr:ABC transporter substrate-binding protein [Actinomycetota bacterium]